MRPVHRHAAQLAGCRPKAVQMCRSRCHPRRPRPWGGAEGGASGELAREDPLPGNREGCTRVSSSRASGRLGADSRRGSRLLASKPAGDREGWTPSARGPPGPGQLPPGHGRGVTRPTSARPGHGTETGAWRRGRAAGLGGSALAAGGRPARGQRPQGHGHHVAQTPTTGSVNTGTRAGVETLQAAADGRAPLPAPQLNLVSPQKVTQPVCATAPHGKAGQPPLRERS